MTSKILIFLGVLIAFAFDTNRVVKISEPPAKVIDVKTLTKEQRLQFLFNENDCQQHQIKTAISK